MCNSYTSTLITDFSLHLLLSAQTPTPRLYSVSPNDLVLPLPLLLCTIDLFQTKYFKMQYTNFQRKSAKLYEPRCKKEGKKPRAVLQLKKDKILCPRDQLKEGTSSRGLLKSRILNLRRFENFLFYSK